MQAFVSSDTAIALNLAASISLWLSLCPVLPPSNPLYICANGNVYKKQSWLKLLVTFLCKQYKRFLIDAEAVRICPALALCACNLPPTQTSLFGAFLNPGWTICNSAG